MLGWLVRGGQHSGGGRIAKKFPQSEYSKMKRGYFSKARHNVLPIYQQPEKTNPNDSL